ncbi:MAG: hypothetical protein ABIR14_02375 [Candidatus Paceibacterota bacterium]
MKKKKVIKKKVVKKAKKKSTPRAQELRIVVQPQQEAVPTTKDFLEPIHEGKKYSVVKTPFTINQILSLIKPTPREQIYTRPGKGGKKFTYVTGSYVEKKLNYLFGFMWDFDVLEHGVVGDFIWVKGKFTGNLPNGTSISKTQFGRAEIKYLKDKAHNPGNMVDYGNDLKAAATDCLKKCASLLGVAADVYGKHDYQQETGVVVRDAPEIIPKEDTVNAPDGGTAPGCQFCGDPISEEEYIFSKKLYGKPLCREHQEEAKRKK